MKKTIIYDGLNVIRRKAETDMTGRVARKILNEALGYPDSENHIWIFDGIGSLATRRLIYPDYKVKRAKAPDGFFDLVNLIRQALRHTRATQVDADGFEADDVIAKFVLESKTGQIHIETTDRDMNALVRQGVTCSARQIEGVDDPSLIQLYKTYVGDPSDNIPGVPLFGPKTWASCNKQMLLKATQAFLLQLDGELFLRAANLTETMITKILGMRDQIAKFWIVVGFLPVPFTSLKMRMGLQVDPTEVDRILKEFSQ